MLLRWCRGDFVKKKSKLIIYYSKKKVSLQKYCFTIYCVDIESNTKA